MKTRWDLALMTRRQPIGSRQYQSGIVMICAIIGERANRMVWAVTLVFSLIYTVAFNTLLTFYAWFWNAQWMPPFTPTEATLQQPMPRSPSSQISVLRNKRVRL